MEIIKWRGRYCMAVSTLVVSGIKPMLDLLGNEQKFILPELNNYGILGLESIFTPITNMKTISHFQLENVNHCGYRFTHTTNEVDKLGILQIQYFLDGSYDSIPLMTISPDGITFEVDVDIPIPPDLATIEYVDNHTWTTSDITDLSSYRLDQFAAPITSLSIGNQKLINVAEPTLNTDAATKYYVDHASTSHVVTLGGAVSGTGNTGTTINTTLNTTLNSVPLPTADVSLNSHKITNLATPTANTDAATKLYVDTTNPSSSVVLQGSVSGTGSTGTPISTTLNTTLNQIPLATADISVNSHKITNLSTATVATDAVNKSYVDAAIGSIPAATVTLVGAVTGSGATGTSINTNLMTKLNAVPAPITSVDFSGQKILNLAKPTLATDGANKGYVDSAIGAIPGGTVTLSGAVSGSGAVGSTISTTLLTTLNNVPIPTSQVNLNSQKIIGLASPTAGTDAANRNYVGSAITSTVVSLTGDVGGSAYLGSQINTTITSTLNQIPAATGSINVNSNKIINLAAPTLAADATNKTYVDGLVTTNSNISGSDNISVTGTNPKVLDLTTTGVTAGSYISPKITLDNHGRISNANDNYFGLMNQRVSKTWNWETYPMANIILTDNMVMNIIPGRISEAALFVQQGYEPATTPPYRIGLPAGAYRYGGSASQWITLSTAQYAIDLLLFRRDYYGQVYLTDIIYNFTGTGSTKTVVNFTGAAATITIPKSINNVCRIRLLGAAGGQSVGDAGLAKNGWSGAGGFTVYHFDTTNYVGQQLSMKIGGGGLGGIRGSQAGAGGYPNVGGRGIRGTTTAQHFTPSGGGGCSEIVIGSTMLAVAGGGGGGSCGSTTLTSYGGAGGGATGQNDSNNKCTGGTQSAGGTSFNDGTAYPASFVQAGSNRGAGSNIVFDYVGVQNCPGGGDGRYGGGVYFGQYLSGSGGSGYINTSFPGYLSSFFGMASATYQGSYNVIPDIAVADPDFSTAGLGAGLQCANLAVGATGGNGRAVVEFL